LVSPEAAERQSTSAAYVNPEIIGAILDEKLTKFSGLLEDKERLIEDKNKIIYLLQNKVGELETRIKSMIALPEYTTEKQKMIEQKQQLEYAIQTLQKDVKRFKTENYVYI
jgi:archaellum component FlaC